MLNLLNTLEQVGRGYLCGANVNRWKNHLFRNKTRPTSPNVQCYFYRFEFQDRGTLHFHLLVWLKDVSKIPVDLIHGHIPWEDCQLAFLVSDLQKSDKGALHLKNTPTEFADRHGNKVLELYHPSNAFAFNFRAYITSSYQLSCRWMYRRQMADGIQTVYLANGFSDAGSTILLYSALIIKAVVLSFLLSHAGLCRQTVWIVFDISLPILVLVFINAFKSHLWFSLLTLTQLSVAVGVLTAVIFWVHDLKSSKFQL